MTFDEYASHDDDVKTCEPLTDEAIIEAVIGQCDDGSADTDDPLEVDGDDTDSNPDISRQPQEDEIIWTSAQFLRFVAQAKAYVLQNKLPQKATEALNVVENALIKSTCQTHTKQSNIMAFFKQ